MKSFEDLPMWKASRDLVRLVYHATRQHQFRHDSILPGQLQRAALCAFTSIAEGHDRGTPRELVHFLHVSRGKLAEVRSLLHVCEDLALIPSPEAERMRAAAYAISIQIRRWITSMQPYGAPSTPGLCRELDHSVGATLALSLLQPPPPVLNAEPVLAEAAH